jgi:putative NADH-flavin reductase
MKIVVFGPTGMIGSRVVAELRGRDHEVTGASRSTGTDVTDAAAVAQALAGDPDAVIVATSTRDSDATFSDVARALFDGLRRAGVSRVINVGGAGSLEVEPGVRLLDTPDFPAAAKGEASEAAEALLLWREVEDLDWTYVSPGAFIHPGERTGRYRLGGDSFVTDGKPMAEVSAEDFAIALADLAESRDHVRERVSVAW